MATFITIAVILLLAALLYMLSPANLKGHPKGLIAAALSNMGERFGYYIMNAVLLLFLCSKFGLSEEKSGVIYSVFYTGIYILSLVGGTMEYRRQND